MKKIPLALVSELDVAVEDSLYTTGWRGVAGTLIVEKITGAAAENGADLDTAKRPRRAISAVRRRETFCCSSMVSAVRPR